MWSIDAAKDLIEESHSSDEPLVKELAEYLGYALDTIKYLENNRKDKDETER